MEQAQAEQLGSRMRDAYADITSEPVEAAPKRVSRRLRKSPAFSRGSKPAPSGQSVIAKHPLPSLLAAAAIGFVLARL